MMTLFLHFTWQFAPSSQSHVCPLPPSSSSSLSPKVLAELEKNWWTDVEDITRGSMSPADAFFFGLLTHETSLQNFELLCCLKNVDTSHGDIFTSARQLQYASVPLLLSRLSHCLCLVPPSLYTSYTFLVLCTHADRCFKHA